MAALPDPAEQKRLAIAQRERTRGVQAQGGMPWQQQPMKLSVAQPPNPFAKMFGQMGGAAGLLPGLGGPGYPGGGYPGGGYPGGGYPGAPGGGGGGGGYQTDIQTNPYQKEAYQAYRDLLGQINEWRQQVPDPEGALQNYRNLQAGTMSEIAKQGGQRGLGGGSGITNIQQLQAAREGREGASKLSYDWLNRAQELGLAGLQALTGATGGMAGLAGGIAGMGPQWYSAVANATNQREQNQVDWYKAINMAQWQPLQYMGGLIQALGGLI